tara:strand:+ start:46532 stop:48157 length:1626 start_codon:yes stop_codon:yes gene_type:complete
MHPSIPYLAILPLLLAGCSTSNASYCDEITPCASEASACDLERNECTAVPEVNQCDEANLCSDVDAPFCVNSVCVACEIDMDCGEDFVCDSENQCTPFTCTRGPGEDASCIARDAATPFCSADGASCRGCAEHSECDSGVCDSEIAECIPASEIVYVEKSGSDAGDCGDVESPCLSVQAGLEKIYPERSYLRILGGSYDEQLSITNTRVTIVGSEGATIEPIIEVNSTVLSIDGTSQVVVDGVNLRANPLGDVFATVVKCVGANASVQLLDLTVGGATNVGVDGRECAVTGKRLQVIGAPLGISVTDGQLDLDDSSISVTTVGNGITGVRTAMTITRSTIAECDDVGVVSKDGSLTLTASNVKGNLLGGVRIENSDYALTNNFVLDNGAPGEISWGGVTIENTDVHSPQQLDFNTIAGNRITGSLSSAANLACSTASSAIGHSNIVYQTFPESSQPNVELSNCILQYSNIEGESGGIGNLDAPPLFINPVSGLGADYHLQQGSPSQDTALPGETGVEVDYDGDPRPQGGRSDMGADEVLAR